MLESVRELEKTLYLWGIEPWIYLFKSQKVYHPAKCCLQKFAIF